VPAVDRTTKILWGTFSFDSANLSQLLLGYPGVVPHQYSLTPARAKSMRGQVASEGDEI
jgi:hypothetical protein